MVMGWRWSILLMWCFSIAIDRVHSQLTGFISIDCGIPAGHNYIDSITNIPYTSDAGFIDTGDNYNVTSPTHQESTLRSFANEPPRNCYTIEPVEKGLKYLVRATFMYGNYDGKNTIGAKSIVFRLHIGVNFWTNIDIGNASAVYSAEALIAPTTAFIQVCLVDVGWGTPFISSLEVRPLEKTIYNAVNSVNALGLLARVDMGSAGKTVRYPDDIYDRIWVPNSHSVIEYPYIPEEWQVISTNLPIRYNDSDTFRVPSTVMQTAVIRQVKNDDWLNFSWPGDNYLDDTDFKYYMNIHFTDIDERAFLEGVRELNVYVNDELWLHNYSPPYMQPGYQCGTGPLDDAGEYKVSIRGSSNSKLPPMMSALEVYYAISLSEMATDDNDVYAMMSIKKQCQVKKNWMGDPCAPQNYTWDGVNCNNYSNSGTPRVITLNLSSSGLTGGIPSSLAKLSAITYLDLSNNNLEGEIPDFLAALPSLLQLNLRGNKLSGSIPPILWSKSVNGSLALSVEGNQGLCFNTSSCGQSHCPNWGSCGRKKRIILSLSIVSVVLVVGLVLCVWGLGRRKSTTSIVVECQEYTYNELEKITKKFDKELGSGGFGTVYYGTLKCGTEVAVKKLSEKSEKATRDFLAEVQILTRAHHTSLVHLVGYWRDGGNLALVYEYIAGGSLQEHLSGERSNARSLHWIERLQIALGAAQGLDYLHVGCRPPVVHRDVKTSNILLNEKLEAKVADFGLAKAFRSRTETHQTLEMIGGTPGYVDPEYNSRHQLSPKSDVYSFGVVLFELITGLPALRENAEAEHIVLWVDLKMKSGGVAEIVDPSLQEYCIKSMTKVVELAKKCTEDTRINRPSMSDVVVELKESLKLEESFKLEADRETPEAPLRARGMT